MRASSVHPRLDRLGWPVRDVCGQSASSRFASGATFTAAGGVSLLAAALSPTNYIIHIVLLVTVLALVALGVFGAKPGGAPIWPSLVRVVGWGVFATAMTAGIGKLFGVNA